jgi:hypothetical protein
LTPAMVDVLVTLKKNSAMNEWAIDEDMEEEVVELESEVEKVPQNSRFLCHLELTHCNFKNRHFLYFAI